MDSRPSTSAGSTARPPAWGAGGRQHQARQEAVHPVRPGGQPRRQSDHLVGGLAQPGLERGLADGHEHADGCLRPLADRLANSGQQERQRIAGHAGTKLDQTAKVLALDADGGRAHALDASQQRAGPRGVASCPGGAGGVEEPPSAFEIARAEVGRALENGGRHHGSGPG
jgi:hypothetical protein